MKTIASKNKETKDYVSIRNQQLDKVKKQKQNNIETNMAFLAEIFKCIKLNYASIASRMPGFITPEAIGYWFRIDDCKYSLMRAVLNNLGIEISYKFIDKDGVIYPSKSNSKKENKTYMLDIDPELMDLFSNEGTNENKQNSHDLLQNNDLTEDSNTYNMLATIKELNFKSLKNFVDNKGTKSYYAYYRIFTNDEVKISVLREFADALDLTINWSIRKMTQEEKENWEEKKKNIQIQETTV